MISNEKAIDAMISLLEHQTSEVSKGNIRDAVIQLICQENEAADLAWAYVIRELDRTYKPRYRHQSKDDEK
jgi:hypothetical protein